MDKVKIQDIAAEASLSNAELVEKAKELGFDVKAGNSTISMENAGILVDYAISGTLPKGFTKPDEKKKITVVKKKIEAVEKELSVNDASRAESVIATEKLKSEVEEVCTAIAKEENQSLSNVEETAFVQETKPPLKEVKKRKGISVVSKKTESEDSGESKPVRRALSRGGIKIVRKAKSAPARAGTKISLGGTFGNKNYEPYEGKKKVKKGPAQAKETGTKIDIFNHDSLSGDIDSGFGEEEVVLLDFSVKIFMKI